MASRTVAECPQAARTDVHDMAHPSNKKGESVFFPSRAFSMHCWAVNKPKPHALPGRRCLHR
jgi:hypothetical protein